MLVGAIVGVAALYVAWRLLPDSWQRALLRALDRQLARWPAAAPFERRIARRLRESANAAQGCSGCSVAPTRKR
ncbi:MAG: hypothetical protein NZM12_01580 [Steroidobacteraceae bacterium]|nr:hypothetical protein [Steroidobacteraceae bacterium]